MKGTAARSARGLLTLVFFGFMDTNKSKLLDAARVTTALLLIASTAGLFYFAGYPALLSLLFVPAAIIGLVLPYIGLKKYSAARRSLVAFATMVGMALPSVLLLGLEFDSVKSSAVALAASKAAAAEKLAKEEASSEHFDLNKSAVLEQLDSLISRGQIQEAAATLSQYGHIMDSTLDERRKSVQASLLRERLKAGAIPIAERVGILRELSILVPDDVGVAKEHEQLASALAVQRANEARTAKRKKDIERQFSGWDGSHHAVVEETKNRMSNPDSFEHIETRYKETETGISVVMRFRGSNAFGGVVTNIAFAEVSENGRVISLTIE